MALPWQTLDTVDTADGPLELRRRGERDFMLTIAGRVLMTSQAHRSELALGALACAHLEGRTDARLLIGGLGLGYTLRGALDALDDTARVVVAELNPAVVRWCRGPLAPLTGGAAGDPRVSIEVDDVTRVLTRGTLAPPSHRFDAIALDLYEGPTDPGGSGAGPSPEGLFDETGLHLAAAALRPGGVLALWAEGPGRAFEKRLGRAGFAFERHRPGKGGLRHAVYLARPGADRGTGRGTDPNGGRGRRARGGRGGR